MFAVPRVEEPPIRVAAASLPGRHSPLLRQYGLTRHDYSRRRSAVNASHAGYVAADFDANLPALVARGNSVRAADAFRISALVRPQR